MPRFFNPDSKRLEFEEADISGAYSSGKIKASNPMQKRKQNPPEKESTPEDALRDMPVRKTEAGKYGDSAELASGLNSDLYDSFSKWK